MKTGIIRRIDDLGRVVIPKEIRKNLGIAEGDELEIFTSGKMICFQKVSNTDELKLDVLGAMLERVDLLPFVLCNADGEIVNSWRTDEVYELAHYTDYTYRVNGDTVAFLSLPIEEGDEATAGILNKICSAYFLQFEEV
jgi:AbrB family looped-hinge helix DNA binding protein